MARKRRRPHLSRKAYVDGKLYRPSVDEARAYYSRGDVQDEILEAMKLWHVRFEPGEGATHRWFNTEDRAALERTLTSALDRMSDARTLFPYFRIDGRRYSPVTSWERDALWGKDLVVEMDGSNWRPCWDAMRPVIAILKSFGVHYWLKYTGHHSLHVVVPAENFLTVLGGVRIAEVFPNLAWRIIAYFDVVCFKPVTDDGFGGGTAGTNMPYSLNEQSGLLNYPVLESEIAEFQPGDAGISHAEVRGFWRKFPARKRGAGLRLLREALKPLGDLDARVDAIRPEPPVDLAELLDRMASRNYRDRKAAVVRLPWFPEREAHESIMAGLEDRHSEVRKAAVKALVGVDHPRARTALRRVVKGNDPKAASWADRVLDLEADIETVRRAMEDGAS